MQRQWKTHQLVQAYWDVQVGARNKQKIVLLNILKSFLKSFFKILFNSDTFIYTICRALQYKAKYGSIEGIPNNT